MIVVTGATGKLGHHVIHSLLEKVPATEVIAAVRDSSKAQDLAGLGVQTRHGDYSEPATLAAAFAGAEKLLLISSNDVENRMPQHKAAVDAAKKAGIRLIAYTSILNADTNEMHLAADHKATEAYIRASGISYVFLRNGWYLENWTEALAPALAHGAILGAAGKARFSAATRKDYAEAAAAVLTGNGHENKVYELAGDTSFHTTELAAEVAKQSGKPVVYQDLPEKAYAEALIGFGLPAPIATMLANSDCEAGKGSLESESKDLSNLIGHPTTPLSEAVREALKATLPAA